MLPTLSRMISLPTRKHSFPSITTKLSTIQKPTVSSTRTGHYDHRQEDTTTTATTTTAAAAASEWRRIGGWNDGASDIAPPPPSVAVSSLVRRWVHSETQIRRLFKNNAARIRVERRMGVDRTPEILDPPSLRAVFEPLFLKNGWSAPPGPEIEIPDYPFRVTRTKNKPKDSIGFLPVYVKYRKDGTKATTIIKKISGDRNFFLKELRAVLQCPAPKNANPRDDAIRVRTGGSIEIKGNRSREIKLWLAGLGF